MLKDADLIGKIVIRKGGGIFDAQGNSLLYFDPDTGIAKFSKKLTGQLYFNDSGLSAQTLKIHNHLMTTAGIGCYEGKTETIATSGTHYGINQEAHISATGTGSVFGVFGVGVVASTFTVTGGWIIGTYGQARADGTMAGGGIMAGILGLIEASAAITASHVCSAWLDSHQANAVTGSHQLLYMTNNGAAIMDEAIYLYGADKITAFVSFDDCDTMVTDIGGTLTPTQKILINVDGTPLYIQAGTVA